MSELSDKPIDDAIGKGATEKARRVYYQNIVYTVCEVLDRIATCIDTLAGLKDQRPKTVSGSADLPHFDIQGRMLETLKHVEQVNYRAASMRTEVRVTRDMMRNMVGQMFRAAPKLHYRKCSVCGAVSMHVGEGIDSYLCRIVTCKSPDTHRQWAATKQLRELQP